MVLSLPDKGEYKFLNLTFLALCVYAGLELDALRSRGTKRFVALMGFLLIPGASIWLSEAKLRQIEPVEPALLIANHTVAVDPVRASMYRWMRTETPNEAVFIDTELTVPVFGERSLYIATDIAQVAWKWPWNDGWGMSMRRMHLTVLGRNETEIDHRMDLVHLLLSASHPTDLANAAGTIHSDVPGRALYVIARDRASRERLLASAVFSVAWKSGDIAVLRYLAEQP